MILKASDQSPRLPTYHFAHAVDDHLMRVTLVIRSEEWISSVPLHQQLFAALGHPPITYAHIAPLMKQIPGGKRKLSKRKDPEASVDFYIAAGYPALAGAVLPARAGQRAAGRAAARRGARHADPARPVRHGGPAGRPGQARGHQRRPHRRRCPARRCSPRSRAWAQTYDPELAAVLATEPDLALRALAVEREGVANPRKDLRKWSDFRAAYGFFFPALFTPALRRRRTRGWRRRSTRRWSRRTSATSSSPTSTSTTPRSGSTRSAPRAPATGSRRAPRSTRPTPDAYHGSIREASQLVRIALTGSTRSPDMHAIATALGRDEVLARLRVLA